MGTNEAMADDAQGNPTTIKQLTPNIKSAEMDKLWPETIQLCYCGDSICLNISLTPCHARWEDDLFQALQDA